MTETPTIPPEPSIGALAKALAAFQAEMPTVAKTKTANAGTYSYKYADLADVTHAAMPLLAKHGLSFITAPFVTDRGLGLEGILMHESGEKVTAALPFQGGTPQQIGSGITYMRRYLLGCLTGVVTDDDDDGQGAAKAARKPPAKKAAAPPPPDPWAGVGSESTSPLLDTTSKLAKAMYATLNEHGIDKAGSLALFTDVTGREVTSSKELTEDEARLVLKELDPKGAES